MLKNERTFTTTYTGGAPNGIAILRTDGSLLVQPYRGQQLVIKGVAEAVLEERALLLAWREKLAAMEGASLCELSPEEQFVGKLYESGRERAAREVQDGKHEWIEIHPNIPWLGGTPRRAFQCKRCFEVRTGEPSTAPPGMGWSGAYYVWNGSDFCGTEALERAREGRNRCAVGAGIESLAAFFGMRALGHLYLGDELIALPYQPADPTDSWPLCAVCGKSAREGKHATDLGEGHDYVPPHEPCDECGGNGIIQKNDNDSFTCPKCKGAG